MIELAVSWVFPPKNQGAGSQLTLLNGTWTVTVTGSPYPAVVGSVGFNVMVAPDIPALCK